MTQAQPFLKWAGGKTQHIKKFQNFYPAELKSGKIKRYFEPFLGNGAVFFEVALLSQHLRMSNNQQSRGPVHYATEGSAQIHRVQGREALIQND